MILKHMKIEEIIRKFPESLQVFEKYGIDCNECHLKEYEDLEQGAKVHNIDLDDIISDLKQMALEKERSEQSPG